MTKPIVAKHGMDTQLVHLSASETAAKIAAGEVSAREVTEAHLEHIASTDERCMLSLRWTR